MQVVGHTWGWEPPYILFPEHLACLNLALAQLQRKEKVSPTGTGDLAQGKKKKKKTFFFFLVKHYVLF